MKELPHTYFLGIDPSATSTGLALLDSTGKYICAGKILPKTCRGGERLNFINNACKAFLKPYRSLVKYAVIEAPAYGASMKADILGQVRGLFILLCYEQFIPVLLAAPTSVKKFATGRGSASKTSMVKAAQNRWAMWTGDIEDDDEADALWMAEIARGTANPIGMTRAQLEVLHQLKHLEVDDV